MHKMGIIDFLLHYNSAEVSGMICGP